MFYAFIGMITAGAVLLISALTLFIVWNVPHLRDILSGKVEKRQLEALSKSGLGGMDDGFGGTSGGGSVGAYLQQFDNDIQGYLDSEDGVVGYHQSWDKMVSFKAVSQKVEESGTEGVDFSSLEGEDEPEWNSGGVSSSSLDLQGRKDSGEIDREEGEETTSLLSHGEESTGLLMDSEGTTLLDEEDIVETSTGYLGDEVGDSDTGNLSLEASIGSVLSDSSSVNSSGKVRILYEETSLEVG